MSEKPSFNPDEKKSSQSIEEKTKIWSDDENRKKIALELGLDENALQTEIDEVYSWYESLSVRERQVITDQKITIAEAMKQRHEHLETFSGLNMNTTLDEAIKEKIHHEFAKQDHETIEQFLLRNGINAPVESCPEGLAYYIKEFSLQDLEFIKKSKDKLISLYTLVGYYKKIDHVKNKITYEDRIYICALPLIHGTSFNGLTAIMNCGHLLSNRELFEAIGKYTEKFFSNTHAEDRAVGLDKFVFAHFGRPDKRYEQQEITLVLDPELMEQEGVFATEHDYLDYYIFDKPFDQYLESISQVPYFYDQAIAKIKSTPVGEKRVGHGTYEIVSNNLSYFAEGVDEDNNFGLPFSTWEVKLPKVKISDIKKIIFQKEEQYEEFKKQYGEQVMCVYEPMLRGKYSETFRIPGEFEKQYSKFVNADYENRVKLLELTPEDQKERKFIIIDRGELASIKSNPLLILAMQFGSSAKMYKNYEDLYSKVDYVETEEDILALVTQPFYSKYIMDSNSFLFVAEIEILRDVPDHTPPEDVPTRIISINRVTYKELGSLTQETDKTQ